MSNQVNPTTSSMFPVFPVSSATATPASNGNCVDNTLGPIAQSEGNAQWSLPERSGTAHRGAARPVEPQLLMSFPKVNLPVNFNFDTRREPSYNIEGLLNRPQGTTVDSISLRQPNVSSSTNAGPVPQMNNFNFAQPAIPNPSFSFDSTVILPPIQQPTHYPAGQQAIHSVPGVESFFVQQDPREFPEGVNVGWNSTYVNGGQNMVSSVTDNAQWANQSARNVNLGGAGVFPEFVEGSSRHETPLRYNQAANITMIPSHAQFQGVPSQTHYSMPPQFSSSTPSAHFPILDAQRPGKRKRDVTRAAEGCL